MEGIRAGIKADRPVAMMEFLKNFYSADGTDGKLVSERVMQANWTVVIGAAPIATLACVDAWIEDFRNDIPRNDVPTMSIHGDDDRILPFDATSRLQAKMIKGVKYVDIKGGSHGITWTRADETRTREFPRLAKLAERWRPKSCAKCGRSFAGTCATYENERRARRTQRE